MRPEFDAVIVGAGLVGSACALALARAGAKVCLIEARATPAQLTPDALQSLHIHLWFAVPSALLLPIMLFTGKTGRKSVHVAVGIVFGIMWGGTFVTGVFFLPHTGAFP